MDLVGSSFQYTRSFFRGRSACNFRIFYFLRDNVRSNKKKTSITELKFFELATVLKKRLFYSIVYSSITLLLPPYRSPPLPCRFDALIVYLQDAPHRRARQPSMASSSDSKRRTRYWARAVARNSRTANTKATSECQPATTMTPSR